MGAYQLYPPYSSDVYRQSKTSTTEGLPGEATSAAETTLMETEEGPGGQALAPERMEMVGVVAEVSNLAGKGSRDPEESDSSTCPPGEVAIQQMASGANRLNLNTKRHSSTQQRKIAIAAAKVAGLPVRHKKSKSNHKP
jgi:hypothetical protein